jgi:hypothetical protein
MTTKLPPTGGVGGQQGPKTDYDLPRSELLRAAATNRDQPEGPGSYPEGRRFKSSPRHQEGAVQSRSDGPALLLPGGEFHGESHEQMRLSLFGEPYGQHDSRRMPGVVVGVLVRDTQFGCSGVRFASAGVTGEARECSASPCVVASAWPQGGVAFSLAPGIVDRLDVFESQRSDGRHLGSVGSRFRPVKCGVPPGSTTTAPGG